MHFNLSIVIHSIAHVINARNFIRNYDVEFGDLNWANGKNDVRRAYGQISYSHSSYYFFFDIFSRAFYVYFFKQQLDCLVCGWYLF